MKDLFSFINNIFFISLPASYIDVVIDRNVIPMDEDEYINCTSS